MKKPRPPEKTCKTCKYWQETTEAHDTERIGFCLRYPPTPLYDPDQGEFCVCPATGQDDWCGEHHPVEH